MDTHAYAFPQANNGINSDIVFDGHNQTIDGSNFSEALKFSKCFNVQVKDISLLGGKEDCLDAVRGSDYVFENVIFNTQKAEQDITAKGGIKGLKFLNCKFNKCVLGQYSIYDQQLKKNGLFSFKFSRPPVRNIVFENCKGTVVLWHSDKPILINSEIKIITVPKFIVFWYFYSQALFGDHRLVPDEEYILDQREI